LFVRKFIILLSLIAVASCTSYKPVVDHRGSEEGVPKRYDDDLSTCRKIAEENINQVWEGYKVVHNWYIRPGMLWLPDKMEMRYKMLVKKCLENRGHNVLD